MAPLPYVLATDVVDVRARPGLPGRRDRRARSPPRSGTDGAALAASLPVLRDAVQPARHRRGARRRRARRSARGSEPRLPVLALAQARMLSDVAAASAARHRRARARRPEARRQRPAARGGARDRARRPGARPPAAGAGPRCSTAPSPPGRRYALGSGLRRLARRYRGRCPAPSGPGPRIARRSRSHRRGGRRCPIRSSQRNCCRSRRRTPGSSTSSRPVGRARRRYQELEPWAWARLTQRLRAVRARRARLRPAAA